MFNLLFMEGPLPLTDTNVEKNIDDNRIGNYALGQLDKEGNFKPKKVGRSDKNVKAMLLKWAKFPRYTHFAYSYATSIKQAYEKECQNYHDVFPALDNAPHPEKPVGKNYPCPNQWCDR